MSHGTFLFILQIQFKSDLPNLMKVWSRTSMKVWSRTSWRSGLQSGWLTFVCFCLANQTLSTLTLSTGTTATVHWYHCYCPLVTAVSMISGRLNNSTLYSSTHGCVRAGKSGDHEHSHAGRFHVFITKMSKKWTEGKAKVISSSRKSLA